MAPSRYLYLPVFDSRLALALTDASQRHRWYQSGLPEDIGVTLITFWDDLPPVPGKDNRWRRLVVTAEPPFTVPGVILVDARTSDDGELIEIRALAHVHLAR